mgnify:FL=1
MEGCWAAGLEGCRGCGAAGLEACRATGLEGFRAARQMGCNWSLQNHEFDEHYGTC